MAISGDNFGCYSGKETVYGISRMEARGATKYLIISRTAPTTKNYPPRMSVVPRVRTLVDTAEGLITKELGKFGSEAHLFDYRLPQGPLG